jgi:2-keto-4-pentenoate hydratase/2-oxohepta-3-ene-1,7-dioic acid hydratase in catechol pathway
MMKIKKVMHTESGIQSLAIFHDGNWVVLKKLLENNDSSDSGVRLLRDVSDDLIHFLQEKQTLESPLRELIANGLKRGTDMTWNCREVIPFQPILYRAFMLNKVHIDNSTKGYLRNVVPDQWEAVKQKEAATGEPISLVNPLFYQKPYYYKGNHLSFVGNGAEIMFPGYVTVMDYELEIGMIVTKELFNATPDEAKEAIGAFCIFNDFSGRDTQGYEMQSGFGPSKSKDFASSISAVITSDEAWPLLLGSEAKVFINDEPITSGVVEFIMPLEEAVAYASEGERIYPGEFMGSGTIGNCCGIENDRFLKSGDTIRLEVDCIGALANTISKIIYCSAD